MSSFGKYRVVCKKGSKQYEIARDHVSGSGVRLAFGSTIRLMKDYDVMQGLFDTPEEAYQALITLQKGAQNGGQV